MQNNAITKVLRDIFSIHQRQKIISKLSKNINKFSSHQFDEFVKRLLKNPLSQAITNYIYTEPSSMFSNPIFDIKKIENEFIWFKNIFQNNSEKINFYIKKQHAIEVAILNNKPIEALALIEEVEKILGCSLWGIEYKTHIRKELLGENNTNYLKGLEEKGRGPFIFFIQNLIYKSEIKNIYTFVDTLLVSLNLMRNAENDESSIDSDYADLFATYFVPIEFDNNRNVNNRKLSPMLNFPLIDQYNIFKKHLSNKKSLNNSFEEYEIDTINQILESIIDKELTNLLIIKVEMGEINEKFIDVIEKYTNTNYKICRQCINDLLLEYPNVTVFAELLARTNLYTNVEQSNNLFDDVSNKFKNIMLLKDIDDAIKYIEKIAIKFNMSTWTVPLLTQLYRLINSSEHKKKYSANNMIILGNEITPLSAIDFSYKKLFHILNIDDKNLPIYRKIKTKDIESFATELEIEDFFIEYRDAVSVNIDYFKDKAGYLLANNKLLECADFIVNYYLDNELNHYFLPIKSLIEKIEYCELDIITIDIPIVYDIYYKRNNNDKSDLRREFYEDFVNSYNTYKPSKIYGEYINLTKKENYFLKYVAIPSVMDITSEIESSIELKKERLDILDILISMTDDSEDLLLERNSILDELVFEKLKASFNSSKIYVDVASLKSDKEYDYKRLYDIYTASKLLHKDDNEEDYITIGKSDDTEVLMPSSDLSNILVDIYTQLLEDFVQDENYGLDKYLSAEIRHDVFFTHLRSSIEKHNLLTTMGTDNTYESNKFLFEEYHIVTDRIIIAIDKKLKIFSQDIDTIIKSANNWFNVIESSSKNKEGMFNFEADHDRLKKLKYLLSYVTNFNEFMETLLSFMWDVTFESIEKIKSRLEDDLKESIIQKIDTLSKDIDFLRERVKMDTLVDSISLARGSIIEEIDTVSNWLSRVENDNDIYRFTSILRESTNMFQASITKKDLVIKHLGDHTDIELTYLEARAVMNSIFITLDNAVKYGTSQMNRYVIEIEVEGQSDINIFIKNKFVLEEELEEFTLKLKEKLSDDYKSLSKKEGGTGLHKIYNLLNNVSDRFHMYINVKEDEFITIIGIKNENNNA